MADVTIEGTVLVVTPIQSSQGRPMVQVTLGDTIKGPVTMPLDMDREMAGVTIAVQRVLTQLPGVGQQLGTPAPNRYVNRRRIPRIRAASVS